jgi:hypothetical protein
MSGVEVWITGGDKIPIKEYAVEIDEEDRVATCWITGEPGQPFAIRWRDISDPIACPIIDGYYSDPYVVQRDLSGFVMMDGYELGGRVLHARSHSPAIFSRIATSPTSCVPLTFSSLPRSAGIEEWTTLGTISLDIHLVQIGEANRLHQGYSSYHRRNEAVPLSSATPFSSTEVTSLRKIATFIFKYRPLDVLQYHSVVPASGPTSLGPVVQRSGDKRPAPGDDSDEDPSAESDEDWRPDVSGERLSTTLVFSDSDSSQDFTTQRPRPKRQFRSPSYTCEPQMHRPPPAKRIKL